MFALLLTHYGHIENATQIEYDDTVDPEILGILLTAIGLLLLFIGIAIFCHYYKLSRSMTESISTSHHRPVRGRALGIGLRVENERR